MHTKPMAEHEGSFGPAKEAQRRCPKCDAPMSVKTWESSCGGYEDEKYSCSNERCGHVVWVDGPDS
jgi:hypothetical protein